MSNNPMVDIQLNKHEDEIAKAKNDIYLQGLGLKWCEEHITALEKKSNDKLPSEVSSLMAQNAHTERLYKGMVREADEYRNRFTETNEKLEAALRVIDSKEETLDMALKNVYKLSKDNENLQKLVNDLTEGKKALEESRNEWKNNTHKANCDKLTLLKENDRLKQLHSAQQETIKGLLVERDNLAASLEAEKIHANACNNNFYEYRLNTTACEKGYQQELEKARSERDAAKALNEQLNADFGVLAENHKALGEQYSDLQMSYEKSAREMHQVRDKLKETIRNLKLELTTYKTKYVNKTIEFNRLNGECLDLKKEYDKLTKAADKYSWKRVNISEILPLEDHELYLFAVDGYQTPVKGRYHDDPLRNITIIVDDGKGPEQKTLFFMDGHIRYWTPLPEMPEGVDS